MPSKPRDALTYVQVDKGSFDRCLARLRGDAKAMETAVNRALNKTATFAKTRIVTDLNASLNLKKSMLRGGKDVKGAVRVSPATKRRASAIVIIKGTRIPLIAFGARQTGKGVTYSIKRGGKRQLLRHGFINIGIKSGKPHVLLRVSEPQPRKRQTKRGGKVYASPTVRPRYDIWKRYGPTLTQVMQTLPEYAKGVFEDAMHTRLTMELDRQVMVILDRKDQKKTA